MNTNRTMQVVAVTVLLAALISSCATMSPQDDAPSLQEDTQTQPTEATVSETEALASGRARPGNCPCSRSGIGLKEYLFQKSGELKINSCIIIALDWFHIPVFDGQCPP